MSKPDYARIIQTAEDVAIMKTQMAEVHRLLIGNGDPGVVRRVNDLEMAAAKQVGIVAGASAVVSLVISGVGWLLKGHAAH